ncbi:MAG TPA: hypothetical protein VJY39_11770 [Acidisphaera sp.]|nr:hypothetical protein [Acidisphaera sp.]
MAWASADLWTERDASLAASLAKNTPRQGRTMEIWMTDDASALAVAGVRQARLGLVQRYGKRLPLPD